MGYLIGNVLCFGLAVVLHLVQAGYTKEGYFALAWCFYFVFCSTLADIRYRVRMLRDIGGNFLEDFCACVFMFPMVTRLPSPSITTIIRTLAAALTTTTAATLVTTIRSACSWYRR